MQLVRVANSVTVYICMCNCVNICLSRHIGESVSIHTAGFLTRVSVFVHTENFLSCERPFRISAKFSAMTYSMSSSCSKLQHKTQEYRANLWRSGGRAVERQIVNRGDGGSIPPTAISKLRQFRSPHI